MVGGQFAGPSWHAGSRPIDRRSSKRRTRPGSDPGRNRRAQRITFGVGGFGPLPRSAGMCAIGILGDRHARQWVWFGPLVGAARRRIMSADTEADAAYLGAWSILGS